jgi:hypothetical protein
MHKNQTEFAVIYNGSIQEFIYYTDLPECKKIDGIPVIRPVVTDKKPDYNVLTEGIREVLDIDNTKVRRRWEVYVLTTPNMKASDLSYVAAYSKAREFFKEKKIEGTTNSNLTVYNATTKSVLSYLFTNGQFIVKVSVNAEVLEWYESDVVVNGTNYAYVSRDTVTGEVIDKYVNTGTELYKTTQAGEVVVTSFTGYSGIPDNYKPLLDDFDFKDRILCWSNKEYGFIVEYIF